MHKVKTAKIIFYFTVSLLFAKPFFGFSVFSRINPPSESNILIKVFSKRKMEYNDGNESDINAVQQKLANPIINLFLRFAFFLAILFPGFFEKDNKTTASILRRLKLSQVPAQPAYVLNGTLLI